MKPSYTKAGDNFLPAIIHEDHKEVLYGDPLVTRTSAVRFAQLHINDRVRKIPKRKGGAE